MHLPLKTMEDGKDMQKRSTVETYRWGFASVPGVLFFYAQELDLEVEDIGVLSSLFYALQQSRPLYQTGISTGQVMQACPFLTKQKLSRKLTRLEERSIICLDKSKKNFTERVIFIEPLLDKLDQLLRRDHPQMSAGDSKDEKNDQLLQQYQERILELESQLEEENKSQLTADITSYANGGYKKVADFISKKTGNLLSVKMASELRRWLEEMAFTPEFLLCMLELCFERNIYNPREISRIARDLKEYNVNTVEGLELYFNTYTDPKKSPEVRLEQFDPDVLEFGQFTGIDMNAVARKKVYYKWRYDWGFSHAMIMKAGEIMCQRTKNGGLEYMDSILNNWMVKEIRRVEDAEKEFREFKKRSKGEKKLASQPTRKTPAAEYEIYVPPLSLEERKSKV